MIKGLHAYPLAEHTLCLSGLEQKSTEHLLRQISSSSSNSTFAGCGQLIISLVLLVIEGCSVVVVLDSALASVLVTVVLASSVLAGGAVVVVGTVGEVVAEVGPAVVAKHGEEKQ